MWDDIFSRITWGIDGDKGAAEDANRLYYATDTGILYYDDGDSWEVVALSGIAKIYKTADETVNDSSTLQNDNHLVFSIGANEKWSFELVLFYTSGTTPDIKFAITVPSGATLKWGPSQALYGTSGTWVLTAITEVSGNSVAVAGQAAAVMCVVFWGYVANSTNAGNVQLQWAQEVANASDTKVLAGSHLIAHKLA